MNYSTLHRMLKGGTSQEAAHIKHQRRSPAGEKAIVQWIVRIEEFVFAPSVSHVKEAIVLPKSGTGDYHEEIGRAYLTRFVGRNPGLVANLSSSFDKRRMKGSSPETIGTHFSGVQQPRLKYNITNANVYNIDEKGLRQGMSDEAKIISVRR